MDRQAAALIRRLDWLSPWLAGYSTCAIAVASDPRFATAALPPGEHYEAFIARTGRVPTRDNLHDFFNACVWLRFPRAKARMNALHVAQLALPQPGGRRGALRDALTVFDENGAVLHAPPALWAALRARRWRELFVDKRALWRQARLVIVGHALLEQLATAPRKPLTAHVLCADAPPLEPPLDAWLEAQLGDGAPMSAKPFTPLPVLGVPDWWPANGEPSFYDDAAVFRPARTS
jgi:hypothetical protein